MKTHKLPPIHPGEILDEEFRKPRGLSQTEFARLLGISVRTLQNWEQGWRKPTGAARVLLRLADLNPRDLLKAAA